MAAPLDPGSTRRLAAIRRRVEKLGRTARKPPAIDTLAPAGNSRPRADGFFSVLDGVIHRGRYVMEVAGDTLNYSEAGAWVRRRIRVRRHSGP